MLLSLLSILVFRVQSVTKTIGPSGSGANYECNGLDDDVQFQKALCEAKGETYNETLNYKEGYNTCGFKHPGTEHDPYPEGELTLNILPGTYSLNRQLYIYSNTEFIGSGIGQTTLKLQDESISFYQKFSEYGGWKLEGGQAGFMRCFFSDNITFTGITFDGNKANQIPDEEGLKQAIVTNGRIDPYSYGRFAIYTEASENIIIDRCEVKNWQGYGLDPHGVGGNDVYGKYLTITNNIVHNNNWDGITIDKTRYFNCSNNHAYNNGRHGINLVTGSEEGEVYNNLLENNGWFYDKYNDGVIEGKGCGIMAQNNQLYGTSDINIYDNLITDSNYAGICLHSVYGFEVYKNEISTTRDSTWCIRLALQSENSKGSYNNDIYENICNHKRGIYITKQSFNNSVTKNNLVIESDDYGVSNKDENEATASNEICNNIYSGTKFGQEIYYNDGKKPARDCDGNYITTTTTTQAPETPDPDCINGIINGDVCCDPRCGTCGGSGCSRRSGFPFKDTGDYCCTSKVRNINRSCDEKSAPCIIQPDDINPADPNCDNGIEKSGVCCPEECGTCGGSGCSQRYLGARFCCISGIKNDGKSCSNQGAPCVL